jgi:hypothetical protein
MAQARVVSIPSAHVAHLLTVREELDGFAQFVMLWFIKVGIAPHGHHQGAIGKLTRGVKIGASIADCPPT